MSLYIIPLDAVSNQTFSVTLGTQSCQITIDTKVGYGVFISLWLDGVSIVQSSIALNRTGIVRYAYMGFVGELYFVDLLGSSDPDYTGFGTRYVLVYNDAATLN